jgi:hypothetical protein
LELFFSLTSVGANDFLPVALFDSLRFYLRPDFDPFLAQAPLLLPPSALAILWESRKQAMS